jgi:hypothetical protein
MKTVSNNNFRFTVNFTNTKWYYKHSLALATCLSVVIFGPIILALSHKAFDGDGFCDMNPLGKI